MSPAMDTFLLPLLPEQDTQSNQRMGSNIVHFQDIGERSGGNRCLTWNGLLWRRGRMMRGQSPPDPPTKFIWSRYVHVHPFQGQENRRRYCYLRFLLFWDYDESNERICWTGPGKSPAQKRSNLHRSAWKKDAVASKREKNIWHKAKKCWLNQNESK